MSRDRLALPASLLFLLATSAGFAQWSANPAANLAVADRTGEQVLPKIAATRDGGCYLAWFDQASGNYDVYLQRLDAAGVEQWPHNGVLVSNQKSLTSLVDWDLICDAQQCAVLAFADARAGTDLDIYAYRVTPAGVHLWGANGVTLSANNDYEPSPRVCQASDGDYVFVWMNDALPGLTVQRLDPGGNPKYGAAGLAIPPDPGDTPGFCRVVAADAGGFIVSWVRALAFTGAKHVHVQKFDAQGKPLWNNGNRLAVFDQAPVPIAHEPRLISDGAGGAVLAWHFAVGQYFSVRVQHVSAAGAELFPHNGVDVDTDPTRSKFDPALLWDAAANEILVFWNERNLGQSQWGIGGNRITAGGGRAWTDSGAVLLPVDGVVKYSPVCTAFGAGALVSVLVEVGPGMIDQVVTVRVDGAGGLVWPVPVIASSVAGDKLRLAAAGGLSGVSMLAWTDKVRDGGDILVQNVNPDGSLGARLAGVDLYGCGVNPAKSLAAGGVPALGALLPLGLDNPLGTQAAGSLPLLLLAVRPDPAYPCGTVVPGLGMAGPGAGGELLLSLAGPLLAVAGPVWAGQGVPAVVNLPLPLEPALVGAAIYAQGVMVDPVAAQGVALGLTNGLRLRPGY